MDIPINPDNGSNKVFWDEAYWVPVNCSDHEGFDPECINCAVAWKATRDGMVATFNTKAG
jgi:hypothetical protein